MMSKAGITRRNCLARAAVCAAGGVSLLGARRGMSQTAAAGEARTRATVTVLPDEPIRNAAGKPASDAPGRCRPRGGHPARGQAGGTAAGQAGPTALGEERANQEIELYGGSAEPVKVRFWGVGNESWDCGGKFTPEDYCTQYRRFATW